MILRPHNRRVPVRAAATALSHANQKRHIQLRWGTNICYVYTYNTIQQTYINANVLEYYFICQNILHMSRISTGVRINYILDNEKSNFFWDSYDDIFSGFFCVRSITTACATDPPREQHMRVATAATSHAASYFTCWNLLFPTENATRVFLRQQLNHYTY